MLLCELNTYELNIISLGVALIMMVLAAISLIVAVRSNRKTAEDFNKLISDTNRATRANILVEIDKLEVEKFRLSMKILDLQAQKQQIKHEPRRTFYMPGGDGVDAQEKLIDEQIKHCKKLHQQICIMQLDMQKIIQELR